MTNPAIKSKFIISVSLSEMFILFSETSGTKNGKYREKQEKKVTKKSMKNLSQDWTEIGLSSFLLY